MNVDVTELIFDKLQAIGHIETTPVLMGEHSFYFPEAPNLVLPTRCKEIMGGFAEVRAFCIRIRETRRCETTAEVEVYSHIRTAAIAPKTMPGIGLG